MEPIDALFRSAHEREAHSRAVARRVLARLEEVEADIESRLVQRLARLSGPDRDAFMKGGARTRRGTERLQATLATIREAALRWRQITEQEIRAAARPVAAVEIELQRSALDDGMPESDGVTAAGAAAAALGAGLLMARPVKWYFDTQQKNVLATIEDGVRTGFDGGLAVGAIGAALVGPRGKGLGLLAKHRHGAVGLVPTVLQHVAVTSSMQVSRARGVEAVRYLTAADGRVSDVCRGLSGTVWPINDPGILAPPRHPRCRSLLVPASILAGGTQASNMANGPGQVPADLSYEDLLRRQPAAWQRDQFTALQWRLWRSGKVSLRGMVDTLGTRGLTDGELAAKYAGIVRELGVSRQARRAA